MGENFVGGIVRGLDKSGCGFLDRILGGYGAESLGAPNEEFIYDVLDHGKQS